MWHVSSSSALMTFNITRADNNSQTAVALVSTLPNGQYEVVALDIEADGSVTMNDCEPVQQEFTLQCESHSLRIDNIM